MEALHNLIAEGTQLMRLVKQGFNEDELSDDLVSDIHALHVRGRFLLRGIDRSTYSVYCALLGRTRDEKFVWATWNAYVRTELQQCVGILKAVSADPKTALDTGAAKVFVSHGRFGLPFSKLEALIRALGCVPVYDTEEPSEGRTINDHVEKLFVGSDFFVVLATAETMNADGVRLPNHNVVIEFDRLVQLHHHDLIVLIEEGCRIPSMLQDVIRESFTPESMDRAFTKLVAGLHRAGLI